MTFELVFTCFKSIGFFFYRLILLTVGDCATKEILFVN